MAKTQHSQFEEDGLITENLSPKQTEDRVLRRLVLEILPSMHEWAERQGFMAKMVVEQTTKNENNYGQVDPQAWRDTLENFTGKTLEVILLKNPLTIKELLAKPEKNPINKRFIELGQKEAEEVLLLSWHQEHGLLASSCGEIKDTSRFFPKIKTSITQVWPNPEEQDLYVHTWIWDRKNFKNE